MTDQNSSQTPNTTVEGAPPIANHEAAEAWNGHDGAHWARHRDRYDAMLAGFTPHLLDAARLSVADRVLDIGCGAGQTTCLAAQKASDGTALGIDISAILVDAARSRATAEHLANARFVHGDAQVHPFAPASVDVAISRCGVMFFAEPVAAFTNIGQALRPDGRLVFLCWQARERNEWVSTLAAALAADLELPALDGDGPGGFSLADPDHTSALLDRAGFADIGIDAVTAPMRLGADPDDVLSYLKDMGIIRGLLAKAEPGAAERTLEALATGLAAHRSTDGIQLGGAAWLVTARRRL